MKFSQPNTSQSSFGIPDHVKEAGEKFRQAREDAQAKAEDALKADPVYDGGYVTAPEAENQQDPSESAESPGEATASSDPLVDGANPIEILEKMGVFLEDEDYHKIVFRGFLEKDVIVVPAFKKARQLSVTFKTLSGLEYDYVDELVAEDLRDMRMTQQGYDTRRSMWVLTFGVSKMDGKPICQPAMSVTTKGKQVDAKATARRKRDVLGLMHPAILSKMIRYHGAITLAINEIVTTPEAEYLKKP